MNKEQYQKEYRLKHREKLRERAAQYYRDNWEKAKKQKREYRIKNLAYSAINAASYRCRKSGKAFDLSKEWVDSRYTGVCELTGIPFQHFPNQQHPMSCSLDRIDNSKGYTQDNCRFILFGLNCLKGTGTDKDMYDIAEALLRNKL